jgi:signal transduction histidine kinase
MSSPAAGERPASAYPAYPGPGHEPTSAQPPLTKRMRPVHWIAIDCVAAGILAICSAAVAGPNLTASGGKLPLLVLLMAVVFVPVALRRRAPVTAFGALVILGVLLSGLPPAVSAVIFLSAAFVLYTVTVESRRRTGAAALGLILVVTVFLASAGVHGRQRSGSAGVLVPVALASVIAWMTGYSVRQRRLYVVTLQQRAASSAVAEERLRIARELHDVVAHSMSVIAVQAGYGQYVIDASPKGAKDALGAIQATSRDALEEMRRMLGVLRQQDATAGPADLPVLGHRSASDGQRAPGGGTRPRQAPLTPAPGLAVLDKLIERTRGAGLRVTLEVTGHPRPAPAGVDLSAYRIIQEALTNVVRHAGSGASCVVGVSYTDADLVIRVTDDGGLPVTLTAMSMASVGSGHGIIGMRERVHLCGGTFNAGPLPNGGFQVMAALPLPAVLPLTDRRPRGDGGRRAEGGSHGEDTGAEPLRADRPSGVWDWTPAGNRASSRNGASGESGETTVTGAVAGNGGGRG